MRLPGKVTCGALPAAAVLLFAAAGAARAYEPAAVLKCGAETYGPFLDFEFRFFAGLQISLPVKHYRGQKPSLGLLVTVTPVEETPGRPVELFDRFGAKQEVPDDAKGMLIVNPSFSIGAGRYRVDWRLDDDSGGACAGSWKLKAALSRDQRSVNLTLRPGEIVESAVSLFRPEPPIARPLPAPPPRRLKIFVSMDIRRRRGQVARPSLFRLHPHFSTVRQLARSRAFNEFSVVLFSFEDQEIVYRQDYAPAIDFRPMRGAIDKLDPQTVDVAQLGKGREMDYFESMLSVELLAGEPPDAVVFVGQETHFGRQVSEFMRGRLRRTEAEFASLDTSRLAWKGAMGNVVRAVKGKEYRLRKPSDLSKALQAIERNLDGGG